ncbi:MAG: hypothetical protein WKF97_18365 [Chitinophagaceae bacterium]
MIKFLVNICWTIVFSLSALSLTKGKTMQLINHYLTSAKEGDDLKPYPVNEEAATTANSNNITLPARSISSFVFSL